MSYDVTKNFYDQKTEIWEKVDEIERLINRIRVSPCNAGVLQAHSMALDTIINSLKSRLESELEQRNRFEESENANTDN